MSHLLADGQTTTNTLSPALTFLLIVLIFGAAWPVSRLFAGTAGNLGNMVKFLVYHFLSSFLVGGLAWLVCRVVPQAETVVAGLVVVAYVVLLFAIPMAVYQIGFLRALGFVVVLNLVTASLTIAILFAGLLGELKISLHDLRQFASAVTIQRPPLEPPRARPDLVTQVQHSYLALQAERAALKVSDPAAVAIFNQHVAEYNALNAQLKQATEAQRSCADCTSPR